MLKIYSKKDPSALIKLLQRNYTRAMIKILTSSLELKMLTIDAPSVMPKEDVKALLKLTEEIDSAIHKLIR